MMNSKINVLDSHFEELVSQSYNKFKIIKENIKALSNQFEEEKLKEEHSLEKKIKERFDDERAKREEEESRIFNIINHRFKMLLNEITNESRNRIDSVENLKMYLDTQNKDNPDLNKNLIKEKNIRIENDNEINEKINQEIYKMENTIKKEKKTRQESEQKIMDLVKSTANKNKLELRREKKERKSAEENILGLIEDTINKINELDDYDVSPEEEVE